MSQSLMLLLSAALITLSTIILTFVVWRLGRFIDECRRAYIEMMAVVVGRPLTKRAEIFRNFSTEGLSTLDAQADQSGKK